MNVGPDPNFEVNEMEKARRQVNRLAEEIAHLSEMDVGPAEYYEGFLQKLLAALAARAGAVWLLTSQGNLQLQYQVGVHQLGLDQSEDKKQNHDGLLRQAIQKGQPGLAFPHSSLGPPMGGGPPASNPTDFVILLAPIIVEQQVAGMVEVWQDPQRGPEAQQGFLKFMVRMAALAAGYTRNHQLRSMVGQQQIWTQLETFCCQIHGSLNPVEVSYLVVNEGRRLAEVDRVSVAVREGSRPRVLAISGADVVEKRSNLVQNMRQLFEAVMRWGEKLVFSGLKDDTLPPQVLRALDLYLAESNSKFLVLLPLRDEREKNHKKLPRSALLMESFEPSRAPEQMVARLEVIGKHATSALYNAAEYRSIPMRFLWLPLAKLQEGLGGKARAITTLVTLALVALVLAMIFVPYPLKMEAKGQLLPIKRAWIYPPVQGHVKDIKEFVKPKSPVFKDQELIRMFDLDLAKNINNLKLEIDHAENASRNAAFQLQNNPPPERAADLAMKREEAEIVKTARSRELNDLIKRTNASLHTPGEFWLRSPLTGIVLSGDFRETLINRFVKPNEPLLRIGFVDQKNPRTSDWEIELKIPQKHIGQVLAAYDVAASNNELDVDFLLSSEPTTTWKGKLARDKVAALATPNRDDPTESEPVVLAWVRVHGKDLPEGSTLPAKLLVTGTEIRARVRCGDHALGYSLFYGVWEFIYEKILWFF